MQEALYHPHFGYYSRHIRGVGRRGDFATSATLGRALGHSIARWVVSVRPRFPSSCHVIEAGAGSGELAAVVLDRLGVFQRIRLFYHIVETSPVLRSEQQQRLAGRRVSWHPDMPSALAAAAADAVVFSNELVDAFPCRLFEKRDGRWLEVAIQIEESQICELLIEPPGLRLPATSSFGLPFADGQRVEVHESFHQWLQTWVPLWNSGHFLTIDYGNKAGDLYHRRTRGSMRAYFHHQRFEGMEVYHRFGRQDITADVNFSDVIAWGESLGVSTEFFDTQSAFLARFAPRRNPFLPHDALLADHHGAGGAFKVLIQRRDRQAHRANPQAWLQHAVASQPAATPKRERRIEFG
jgi:SAM-dependent MidA family methyltransferase